MRRVQVPFRAEVSVVGEAQVKVSTGQFLSVKTRRALITRAALIGVLGVLRVLVPVTPSR